MEKKESYLITYQCSECNNESAFAEKDSPVCRFCETATSLTLVSKLEITPQLMEERIKALSESMLSNLQRTFENMTDNERAKFPEGKDAEREMLALLAKVKNLKDNIDGICMDDTPDDVNSEDKK